MKIRFKTQAHYSTDGHNKIAAVAGEIKVSESKISEKVFKNFVDIGIAEIVDDSKEQKTVKPKGRQRKPTQTK